MRHNIQVISPSTPVQFLKGVGEGRAKLFETAGITTVRDLLYYFPYRYEDRRHPSRLADLRKVDTPVVLRGRVAGTALKTSPKRRMKIFEVLFDDGTGTIVLVWFNQPFLADQIRRDDRLMVYGLPRLSSQGRLQIDSPDWEKLPEEGLDEEGAIVPIYSRLGNIPPKTLRKIVSGALEALPAWEDPLPLEVAQRLQIVGLPRAIEELHRPAELGEEFLNQRSPAHRRVILEEFFTFQLALRVRRAAEEIHTKPRQITIDDAVRAEVRRILPFRLTSAQKRVLREITDDLRSERPMYRLLQGDVGSGKTIVALIAAIVMIRNGHQVALLAPTEILVEQHEQRIRQLVGDAIVVAKATGSMTAAERRALATGLRDGTIDLVIGTHALLEKKIAFHSLGLAIVDEQHRFGVEQRQTLFAKGESPDILVMTATPIPRSLAMAIFGDLELSVIDELPPGRKPVKTVVRSGPDIEKVHRFIDEQIDDGAQVYVVYPIIDESEKVALRPLTHGFETFRSRFPNRRLAMLHGRMSPAEKEETMRRFKNGETDILVSTTVIEVGIDVPNASIMLIVDADRFGLSQLHQLRGRVGRGSRKSYCVLLHEETTPLPSRDRLRLFAATNDGFDVAERDLELRGPGEFLGTKQSGLVRFRFGNLLRDHDLMELARDAAIEYIEKHGTLVSRQLVQRLIGRGPGVARD